MKKRLSCKRALHLTKLSVLLACTWPPSRNASKSEIINYDIAWCFSFLSALCLLLPLIFAIFKYNTDSLIVTQSVCFIGATLNLLFKMVVYRIYMERTQTTIEEMENFLDHAKPHEEEIMQRYVDRCSKFHGFMSILNYLTTAIGVSTPLFISDKPLPTSAYYPFLSLDSGIPMYLAYIHQTFAGFQCSSGVTIDCQAAVMMWYAGARIEILANDLKDVTDRVSFKKFVIQHKKLIDHATDVSNTMSYVALASSTACGIAAIMSGLQVFGNQPLVAKMQFAPIAIIATLNLFICAWPAENLINVCDYMGDSVYNGPWVDMPIEMTKNILFLLGRCQRAVIVSVAGFLPTLSLRSYASFLSATFSYFTTLRLVLTSNGEK